MHGQDARDEIDGDPWREAGERWASIGDRLREQYRVIAGDEGPTEHEVRDAAATLGDAARRVVDALGSAMRDAAVREQVRDAAASLVSALGVTMSELAEELRRARAEDAPAEPGDAGAPEA